MDIEGREKTLLSEATFFRHRDEVLEVVLALCGTEWEHTWNDKWEWLQATLSLYQEQPTLLTPHLEELIVPLTSKLLRIMEELGVFDAAALVASNRYQRITSSHFHAICKVLQLFCRVRGYKHIIKFFPHEVHHIEPCLLLLSSQDRLDFTTWETSYILLLWLCILCLIPFDICSIDSSIASSDVSSTRQSKLVIDIIHLCKDYLSTSGPTREAAYACLSSLFTRPDMDKDLLGEFFAWTVSALDVWVRRSAAEDTTRITDSFQLIGLLNCLNQIFKKGHRSSLLPFADMVLSPCLQIIQQTNQTLVRKLLMKVLQRIGLTYLPPKEAAWRYQRGSRSLLANISSSSCANTCAAAGGAGGYYNAAEEDVPPQLEDIVGCLVTGLADKDTVVRWSAAKGIGRVTMRLPSDFGDDVVAAVIDCFSDDDDEHVWHGGCLALAELARRGLLLPERLATVVPLIEQAMLFDKFRGQYSVGSHVRDAACYVCWSFARAYAADVMKPFVAQLAISMLLTTLFDREINCRRAASAAYQENVGRQGNANFPYGIEIITVADYFSLSSIANAYTSIAPLVAAYDKNFYISIMKHLIYVKAAHWDIEIRKLTAKAVGGLCKLHPHDAMEHLKHVLCECQSSQLSARHGALLVLSELLLGLQASLPEMHGMSVCEEIIGLVPALDKASGRGSEICRSASCLLIESIARCKLAVPVKLQVALTEALHENLRQPHDEIQQAAVSALQQFLFTYFPCQEPSERLQKLTLLKYMEGLEKEENAAVTRGAALALGILPMKFLHSHAHKILSCLDCAMKSKRKIAGEDDIETRRNIVISAGKLAERIASYTLPISNVQEAIETALRILFAACEDYSVDKRGDTGSWCRVAGMLGLEKVLFAVTRRSPLLVASTAPFTRHMCFARRITACNNIPELKLEIGCAVWTADGFGIVRSLSSSFASIKYPTAAEVLVHTSCVQVIAPPIHDSDVPLADSTVVSPSSTAPCDEVSLSADQVHGIVAAVLRQVGGKLDAVREVAGGVLERIVSSTDPTILQFPDRKAIEAAKSRVTSSLHDSALNWSVHDQVYLFLTYCMESELYFDAILYGFVLSIGGLTESITKSSQKHMLQWCNTHSTPLHLSRLAKSIDKLFQAYAHDNRVIVPLLKTCYFFLKHGVFDVYTPPDEADGFAQLCFRNVNSEMKNCNDVSKLRICADILILLFQCGNDLRRACLRSMVLMLGHKYPKMRKYASEQLYLQFIADPMPVVMDGALMLGLAPSHESYATVLDILMTSVWDGEVSVAREQRQYVCKQLDIQLKPVDRATIGKKKEKGEKKDELDSYETLVRDAGY